jgi:hypothetical protein
MTTEPYEVVRSVLEAEGWSVGSRKEKGVFEAEYEERRLTGVIANGNEPQQIAAAYRRLLDVHAQDDGRYLAIVLTRQGFNAAHRTEIRPRTG